MLTMRRSNRQSPAATNKYCSAFTLLEVILALAILGGSLAVLSEIMSLATRQAVDAQAESDAQILAESVMDELIAGALPLEEVREQQMETTSDVPWIYSIEISENEFADVQIVRVIVQQELEVKLHPAKYELVRWLSLSESSEAALLDDSTNANSGANSSTSPGQTTSGASGMGVPRG